MCVLLSVHYRQRIGGQFRRRIFFDLKLVGDSTSPRDLLKLLDSVDELLTGEYNWIVEGVHDHGVIDSPPTLEDLELRWEEAPDGTPPDFLQDFTTTCEPD